MASAAVLLVLAVAGLAAGTVLVGRERDVARLQRDRALAAEEEARRSAARAQDEAAIARAVSEFLQQDLLAQAGP